MAHLVLMVYRLAEKLAGNKYLYTFVKKVEI